MKHACILAMIFAASVSAPLAAGAATAGAATDGGLLRLDHYVQVRSAVPAIAGQSTQIYVREVVHPPSFCAEGRRRNASRCSFMARARRPRSPSTFLTRITVGWRTWRSAGFDVFAMDMTGYGRSTRPPAMNDPCNLSQSAAGALRPVSDRRSLRLPAMRTK